MVEVVEEVKPPEPQAPAVLPEPPKPVAKAKLSPKDFVVEQFKLGKPVFVVALEKGEHPRNIWRKEGEKFKLEQPEAYSHRWMKLA